MRKFDKLELAGFCLAVLGLLLNSLSRKVEEKQLDAMIDERIEEVLSKKGES